MRRFLYTVLFCLGIVFLTLLPFVLLLRGAAFLMQTYGYHAWAALFCGSFLPFVLLLVYMQAISRKILGRGRMSKSILKGKAMVAGLLMLGFWGYALLSFSGAHAKTEAVQQEFQMLHPFLRVGVGMVLLADRSLVVTGVARTPEGYQAMGLPSLHRSLHYTQPDGYVHAVDLRTSGRNEVRNWLLEFFLRWVGFQTLRHVGTADHLHVSLP